MTIQYLNKDITTVDRGIIAHGCNTQGVMGSGVAKFLRDKYPSIFPRYAEICAEFKDNPEHLLGDVVFEVIGEGLVVANCFTQHLYGRNGKFATADAIRDSLAVTYGVAGILELPVYLPKIGAGRGGLDWDTEVEPIVRELSELAQDSINTYVCVWAE
jgi:O-acetyl-ADP-ribose deacetylase (regulator of RNase III)